MEVYMYNPNTPASMTVVVKVSSMRKLADCTTLPGGAMPPSHLCMACMSEIAWVMQVKLALLPTCQILRPDMLVDFLG